MEYGLIGEKLGHSYSPQIHARLGEYSYELKEIPPDGLDDFLTRREFKGLNVTIPYKREVMARCDELSRMAREVGCVNTVVVRPDGTLYGHNTDVEGFVYMLRRARIDPRGRKAVVLGSGGTSLTARTALRHLGAREVVVISRRGPVDYEALYAQHADAEILVNTTPVGMYPQTGVSAADLSRLPNVRGVVDVIYNPEKTALILDAEARKIPAVSGLSMLVAQARAAAVLFTGSDIPEASVEKICGEIRAEMLNLVLIGMPGCGKSALGRRLAKVMERPLIDCDAEIVERAGMTIQEIFDRRGEKYFRDLESEVLRDVCRTSGCIIATGGGAVMRPENVRAMRQNGRVCFVRRRIDQLARRGRPLSSRSGDAVTKLWIARKERYIGSADYIVRNDAPLKFIVQRIREGFYEAARH